MIAKLFGAALAATLSTATFAAPLHETHEQVSAPGKSTVAYRPLERAAPAAGKCHPDATKAVSCEARLQMQRADALAARQQREAVRLSQR